MRTFIFWLFMLFLMAFACCGYNSYALSKFSQISSETANNGSEPIPFTTAAPATNDPVAEVTPPKKGQMTRVKATFYTDVGLMADGHPTHVGACAAYLPQFPFGTKLKLYRPNNLNQPVYTCTVEDSGVHICQDNIDVWMASVEEAIKLGVKDMLAQVVGLDQAIAEDARENNPSSKTGCTGGKTH